MTNKRRLVRIGQIGTTVFQIIVDCLDRLRAQWHLPATSRLTRTGDLIAVKIDIVDIERHELAHAHSGGVERFDHGQIAECVRTT